MSAEPSENIAVLRFEGGYRAFGQVTGTVVSEDHELSALVNSVQQHLPAEGGEIVLGPGRFVAAEPIELSDNVTLAGSGRSTVLTCSSGTAPAAIIAERVSGVTVRRLAVVARPAAGPRNGVMFRTVLAGTVEDLFVASFPDRGVVICDDSALTRVARCTIVDCRVAGLSMRNLSRNMLARYGDFAPTLVSENTIWRGGTGIEFERAILATVSTCITYQCTGAAFRITESSNSISISSSRAFQTCGCSVIIRDSNEVTLTGNVFGWHEGHGVDVLDSSWGVISGNSIIDTGSVNPGGPDRTTRFEHVDFDRTGCDGIRLRDVNGYTVSGNAIFNWAVAPPMAAGIRIGGSSRSVVAVANSINLYREAAIVDPDGVAQLDGNNGVADTPHRPFELDGVFLQSYQPELSDQLIRAMTSDPPTAARPFTDDQRRRTSDVRKDPHA